MRRAHAKEIHRGGRKAHDRGSRGAMEQAQCKSGVAYAPCVVREWSHRSGLRGFASAERPSLRRERQRARLSPRPTRSSRLKHFPGT